MLRRWDMKRRFSEEQIIGFLGEAEVGLPIKARLLRGQLLSVAQATSVVLLMRVGVCITVAGG